MGAGAAAERRFDAGAQKNTTQLKRCHTRGCLDWWVKRPVAPTPLSPNAPFRQRRAAGVNDDGCDIGRFFFFPKERRHVAAVRKQKRARKHQQRNDFS